MATPSGLSSGDAYPSERDNRPEAELLRNTDDSDNADELLKRIANKAAQIDHERRLAHERRRQSDRADERSKPWPERRQPPDRRHEPMTTADAPSTSTDVQGPPDSDES
jgi:hypothetical protein